MFKRDANRLELDKQHGTLLMQKEYIKPDNFSSPPYKKLSKTNVVPVFFRPKGSDFIAEGDIASAASVVSPFSYGPLEKAEFRKASPFFRKHGISPTLEADYWSDEEKKNWIQTGDTRLSKKDISKNVFSPSYLKSKTKKVAPGIEQKKHKPLKPFVSVQACNELHNPKYVSLCSCNDIFRCKVCEVKRMKETQEEFRNFMLAAQIDKPKKQTMKMLTLTLKREFGFKKDRERLLKAFTRLRHRKDWKNKVSFYKGRMEVVENNIHLHIVLTSHFWNQKEISKAWLECTGNSFIVDVRKVNDVEKASLELAKYVCKDTDEELKTELAEFRDENKGSRFVFTGRRPPSLDTIATSRQKPAPLCECCHGLIFLHGEFKDQKEAEKWVEAQPRGPDGDIRCLIHPKTFQKMLN